MENMKSKPLKAKVFPSERIILAIMCMLATYNFMFQRLTINFGLVCMVKSPSVANNSTPINEMAHEIGDDQAEFEWSRDVQGLILASFYYGFVFAQIPGGWFSDRFGAKRALIMSGFLVSIFTLFTPLAARLGPNYLIGLRLAQGISNGAAMPAISTLSSRWFAALERGFMLGIAYSGFAFATSTTYPIAAFFCENTGWPGLFYFAGIFGLLWCVATFFLIFEWPETHPRIGNEEIIFVQKYRAVQYTNASNGPTNPQVIPWMKILFSVRVWALLISNFGCTWVFISIGMYLPTYTKEVLRQDISQNGILSAIPFVCTTIAHFLVAIAFDWIRKMNYCSVTVLRKGFNSLGAFGAALAMGLIGFVPSGNVLGPVVLITMGQIFVEFAFTGGYVFSIFELAPKFAGTLTAIMNTFGFSVGLLSPPLVSYLTSNGRREDWLIFFNISAGICALGGVFYVLFGTSELQDWAVTGRKSDNNNVQNVGSSKDEMILIKDKENNSKK